MSQYQNLNQFAMTAIKGGLAQSPSGSVLSCQIATNSGSTFYGGTAVKLIAGTSQQILVEKTAATEAIFGFVIYNPKKPSGNTAGDTIEVALPGSIMYMESSASFNRGQLVEQVATGDKVAAYAGVNTTVGVALDTSSGANQLVRVMIRTVAEYSSSSSSSSCRSSSSSSSSSAA